MRVSVVLAQIPVGFAVPRNLDTILGVLVDAEAGDIVVTPEGALTGYPLDGRPDIERLAETAPEQVPMLSPPSPMKLIGEVCICGSACANRRMDTGRTRRSASSPMGLG